MASSPKEPERCPIAEIVQYSCELELARTDGPVIRCFPLSRLFKMCPGRPAVEMTNTLNVDENGIVENATDINQPRGKLWQKVIRYEEQSGFNS
ncbi:hypothetical protein GYMLUDRAFT_34549 [Collybiopsis luxurians FD-317 M1]|nr:hypothetical protein GYMLUDRAFT_34549 [Collybiopsis luxurians FD-317 M1]